MKLKGMLADVNVQGHLAYIRVLLVKLDLLPIMDELGFRLATFADLQISRELNDRALWRFCQEQGWILLTENRNHDGPDSLVATLEDSWKHGDFPVLTLANKGRFENDVTYALLVADQIAGILVDVNDGKCVDEPRVFLPRSAIP